MKLSLVLLALLFFSFNVRTSFAQQDMRAAMSGNWVLDLNKSKVSGWASRDELSLNANSVRRITATRDDVTIQSVDPVNGNVLTTMTFLTDDKERKTDDGTALERAKWDGKKLVVRRIPVLPSLDTTGKRNRDGSVLVGVGTIKVEIKIEWEMLESGLLTERVRKTARSNIDVLGQTRSNEQKSEVYKVFVRDPAQ